MYIDPALQGINIPVVKRRSRFWRADGGRHHAPFLILRLQICEARIVRRPESFAHCAVNQIFGAGGVEIIEHDGALGAHLGIVSRVKKFFAVVRKREFRAGNGDDFFGRATADDNFAAGSHVGYRRGSFEIGDGSNRRLFLVGVIVIRALIYDFREKFRGNAGAAVECADLPVFQNDAKRHSLQLLKEARRMCVAGFPAGVVFGAVSGTVDAANRCKLRA